MLDKCATRGFGKHVKLDHQHCNGDANSKASFYAAAGRSCKSNSHNCSNSILRNARAAYRGDAKAHELQRSADIESGLHIANDEPGKDRRDGWPAQAKRHSIFVYRHQARQDHQCNALPECKIHDAFFLSAAYCRNSSNG